MLIYLEVSIEHGILVLLLRSCTQTFVRQVLVIVIDEGLEVLDLYHLPAILSVLYQ